MLLDQSQTSARTHVRQFTSKTHMTRSQLEKQILANVHDNVSQIAKNRNDQQRKLDSYVLGILLGVGILIGTLLKVSNMSLTYYSRSLKIHCVRT